MERLIFDTHAHYTAGAFDQNREKLLQSLPAQGVALVLDCGTDLASSEKSLALAEKYAWLYTAAGIHPQSLIQEKSTTLQRFQGNWKAEMEAIALLYSHPKVLAVGEIGLDHHWPVPREAQLHLFEAQLRAAAEYDLPVIVHDREAHEETYNLLKKYKPKGVLHAYSGSVEDAKWINAQGMYISFTGVITFKNARRMLEVAAAVPQDYYLLETDCPYLAPEPYRGQKSNSAMIACTAAAVAKARGMQPEDVMKQATENGKRLFAIQ